MVNQASFDKAMKAALEGPEVKKVKIDHHEFNVKPLRFNGSRVTGERWKGQISHHLSLRDDDQVHYEFDLLAGDAITIGQIDIDIDPSFMQRIGSDLVHVVGDMLTIWLKDEVKGQIGSQRQLLSTAGREQAEKDLQARAAELLDGSWEGEAKYLILNIAGRKAMQEAIVFAARSSRPPVRDHRGRAEPSAGRPVVRDHRSGSEPSTGRSPVRDHRTRQASPSSTRSVPRRRPSGSNGAERHGHRQP
jgi:hypothetical protein